MDFKHITNSFITGRRLPVLFIGHGHPMNAIQDNAFTKSLVRLGREIQKPRAILVISAHWETIGTYVSTNPQPRAIYDFGPFDPSLYDLKYEPQGAPFLAREAASIVASAKVNEDPFMGLDHGAWTVLRFLFPFADVPVFEMSMDYSRAPGFHYELGKELSALRDKGVLIICSGNIVHNLYKTVWSDIDAAPYDWVIEFDEFVKEKLIVADHQSLISFQRLGHLAEMAVPTNEHYLPLLYTLGMISKGEPLEFIFEGYQYAGISMRCLRVG